jgi:molybdate transport system substrate-binding protein
VGAHREDLRREGRPINILSAGAAQALVGRIAAARGVTIAGHFGAVGAMLEKFLAGEPCDVVILTQAQIVRLADDARVLPGTGADLGSVATSIAVRADDVMPDVHDAAALKAALAAATEIYFPDPAKATAGIHFAKVLDALGVGAEVAAKRRTFPNGATAMRAMAEARGHPIGCTQATEIRATPGIRLVGKLPRGHELDTVYTAAVSARAVEPEAARAFVTALTGEESRVARMQAGFDVVAANK